MLYDLQADLSEQADVSGQHPEVTERLSSRLIKFLQETGAKFPRKDPQYDPQKEAEYLESIEQELLPKLEKQRMEFLSPDYNPGNNWWGSQVEEKINK